MPANGQAVAETTVQHVARCDMLDPTISTSIEKFNEALNKRLDDANFNIAGGAGFSLKKTIVTCQDGTQRMGTLPRLRKSM